MCVYCTDFSTKINILLYFIIRYIKSFLKVKKKKEQPVLSVQGRNCWLGQLWVTWLIRATVSLGGGDGGLGAPGPSLENASPPRASAAPLPALTHPCGQEQLLFKLH